MGTNLQTSPHFNAFYSAILQVNIKNSLDLFNFTTGTVCLDQYKQFIHSVNCFRYSSILDLAWSPKYEQKGVTVAEIVSANILYSTYSTAELLQQQV